jgi:hypothetical protein
MRLVSGVVFLFVLGWGGVSGAWDPGAWERPWGERFGYAVPGGQVAVPRPGRWLGVPSGAERGTLAAPYVVEGPGGRRYRVWALPGGNVGQPSNPWRVERWP